MRPKWAPEGLPGGVWAAWGPFGPLGALRAALGAVLGALGPLLGPPGARLGLTWASRGGPFGAFWASVEGSLAKSRKPRISLTVHHFLRFFRSPGGSKIAMKSLRNRSQACLGASGRFLGPREAVLTLCGPLRGPSAWLLGRPWVAPDRSDLTATRAPYVTASPKTV